MKLVTLALGVGLMTMSALQAAPYYVGKQLNPENNITLGFTDTPTKSDAALTGSSTGNIAAFELKGDYNVMPNLALGANVPFYMLNKKATATGESRTTLGNIGMTINWNTDLSTATSDFRWGYSAAVDTYLPTSKKTEAAVLAFANPSVDLYTYHTKATTVHPRLGLYFDNERFYAKTNVGYGFMYVSNGNAASGGSNDKSRNTITWHNAFTWKAMSNLNCNLEYNAIALDTPTRAEKNTQYRHTVTPSLSGDYNNVVGQVFANIPLDAATRKIQKVAFGANIGYQF